MKKNGLLLNLFWKFAERITAQLVTLVVSIILARLLEPEHYGTISMVMIFITIANVFVSDGFGSALVQKKNSDSLDFFSVMYFNIGFSLVLYAILFMASPYISAFFGEGYEILTPVLRVLGIRIIISGVNSVQQAYVSKNMIFRKFFWATLFGTIVSAIVGIWMAYRGFGVWALVAQYLTNTTVDTIVLWLSLRIKLKFQFSIKRLKTLMPFGSRILATSLMIQGYQELRALFIGKIYSSSDLAFYDKGKQFPNLLSTNINSSLAAVLFPKMSMQQDDVNQVKKTTRMSIQFGAYIMCPMMLGMAAVSRQFVTIVLTEKWLPCVPFLQLLCINSLCMPLHTANMQAIKAMGRSDITFRLELIKKGIELVTLLAVMRISVFAIVIAMVACSIFFVFLNAYPNIKLIGYSIREQICDIIPSILLSSIMAITVYFVGYLELNIYLLFVLQVILGIALYWIMSVITRNEQYKFIFSLVSGKLKGCMVMLREHKRI